VSIVSQGIDNRRAGQCPSRDFSVFPRWLEADVTNMRVALEQDLEGQPGAASKIEDAELAADFNALCQPIQAIELRGISQY
jgi:hypothetical protein